MKFLIDTNIFIPLEPTGLGDFESGTPAAIDFLRMASAAVVTVYMHPESLLDIGRDKDIQRRILRESLFNKYPSLPDPPSIPDVVAQVLGSVKRDSNDWVDHHLLAAIHMNAVDVLVTEDVKIRKKALRLNVADRVMDVKESCDFLRRLFDTTPKPPPAVVKTKAHNLNEHDPLFDSLRADYPGFDSWLNKCKTEHRQAWYISDGHQGPYSAVCLVNREKDANALGLKGKVLKVCTFKVAEDRRGRRYGELLLKPIFDYAALNSYDWIFIEAFEKQQALVAMLSAFGFEPLERTNERGELRLVKPMKYTEADVQRLDPLSFNKRFGPFVVKIPGVPGFVIPIQPHFHRMLFPEAEAQNDLFPGQDSFGNGIRKAYICNAVTRQIMPGSILLFYRSMDTKGIRVIGMAEDILASRNPNEIARFVGRRTVYSYREIESKCQTEALVILFRQVRVLGKPIPLPELVKNRILTAAPQSITRISDKATRWLQVHLGK